MKHLLILLSLLPLSLFAQSKDYRQAIAKYKDAHTVTATAIRRRHKAAVAKDETAQGTLTIQQAKSRLKLLLWWYCRRGELLLTRRYLVLLIWGYFLRDKRNLVLRKLVWMLN